MTGNTKLDFTDGFKDCTFTISPANKCSSTGARYRLIDFIIPPLHHFTILGQKNAQNMPRYYTVEQGKNTD